MDVIPVVDEGLGNSAYVVDRSITGRFVTATSSRWGGLTLEVIATPGHTPEHLAYLLRDGSRSVALFSGGHVPGSLSNAWRGQFATWLGWLVDRTRPVASVADDTIDRLDLMWVALTVGFEHLVGELAGGVDAWRAAGRALATTPLVDAADTDGRQVLDIRQQAEFTAGTCPVRCTSSSARWRRPPRAAGHIPASGLWPRGAGDVGSEPAATRRPRRRRGARWRPR